MASISRLALALTLLGGGGASGACSDSKRVGVVIIEGEIDPELMIGAFAYVRTNREGIFCERTLLQRPTARSTRVQGKAQKLEGRRYRIRLDFTGVPQGGFCRWTLRPVFVKISHTSHPTIDVASLWLEPEYSRDPPWKPPEPPPEPVMATLCHPGPPDDPNAIACRLIERTVPDFYGDKKFVLNVAWDPKYEPPVEQYVPSEPWQPQ